MALLQPLKFALSATAINFNVKCANIINANLRFLEPMLECSFSSYRQENGIYSVTGAMATNSLSNGSVDDYVFVFK